MSKKTASMTGSFAVSDAPNEVVCPLKNQDGTFCRKRCFGEKRYRSMQEHIRRAHPDHYIPKLPATEDSFNLMINTAPSDRPLILSSPEASRPRSSYDTNIFYKPERSPEDYHGLNNFRRGSLARSANAAAALAQLHNSAPQRSSWDPEPDSDDEYSEGDDDAPYLQDYFPGADSHQPFIDNQQGRDDDPINNHNFLRPPIRSSSLRATSAQPFNRPRPNRPRKHSVTEHASRPKHERDRSREWKRRSYERKAYSVEPGNLAALNSKRWEDLLDAAASATEEDSRDLTPIPQSPRSSAPLRASLPPFQPPGNTQFQSYTASPLHNAMLPPSPEPPVVEPPFEPPSLEPFPSVESFESQPTDETYQPPPDQGFNSHQHQASDSSAPSNNPYATAYQRHHAQHSSTGSNFHIPPEGLSSPQDQRAHSSSMHSNFAAPFPAPQYSPHHPQHHSPVGTHPGHTQQPSAPVVQHYCAGCHRIVALANSYACNECICGICRDCVDVLVDMGSSRIVQCPRCQSTGVRFKPFMLDLR